MAENLHGLKFTAFRQYCKHIVTGSDNQHWFEECGNKRNKMLKGHHVRPPCNKPYCPAFRATRVVIATRHYEQGSVPK